MIPGNITKRPRAKRTKKPRHTTVTRAYGFPMEVNPQQQDRLMMWLGACWRLRNSLVSDRKGNRKENRSARQRDRNAEVHYLNRADQYRAIAEYAGRDTALSKVHSQVRQNVAVRVDEGYKRFLEALKKGDRDVGNRPTNPSWKLLSDRIVCVNW